MARSGRGGGAAGQERNSETPVNSVNISKKCTVQKKRPALAASSHRAPNSVEEKGSIEGSALPNKTTAVARRGQGGGGVAGQQRNSEIPGDRANIYEKRSAQKKRPTHEESTHQARKPVPGPSTRLSKHPRTPILQKKGGSPARSTPRQYPPGASSDGPASQAAIWDLPSPSLPPLEKGAPSGSSTKWAKERGDSDRFQSPQEDRLHQLGVAATTAGGPGSIALGIAERRKQGQQQLSGGGGGVARGGSGRNTRSPSVLGKGTGTRSPEVSVLKGASAGGSGTGRAVEAYSGGVGAGGRSCEGGGSGDRDVTGKAKGKRKGVGKPPLEKESSMKKSKGNPKIAYAAAPPPHAAAAPAPPTGRSREGSIPSRVGQKWKIGMPAAVGLVTPSGRVPGLGVMLKEMWSKINKHRSSWAFWCVRQCRARIIPLVSRCCAG